MKLSKRKVEHLGRASANGMRVSWQGTRPSAYLVVAPRLWTHPSLTPFKQKKKNALVISLFIYFATSSYLSWSTLLLGSPLPSMLCNEDDNLSQSCACVFPLLSPLSSLLYHSSISSNWHYSLT